MSDTAPLLFIDTNIFLDFYRATGSADFKLLDRLKAVKGSIITTHQVEMEFQNNRQRRMAEAFDKLELARLPEIPGMFVGTNELDELNEAIKQVKDKVKILQNRLTGAVVLPSVGDPVYKATKEIFSLESPLNLTRSKPEYPRILRLARRRFMLGYPPRKDKDTSMGDAVNWEWVVECAIASKRSVIIVSRDGDYGLSFDKQKHLNEWLFQEFIERVRNNNIQLTDSLSTALKKAKVPVTRKEQEAEQKLIATYNPFYIGQQSDEDSKRLAETLTEHLKSLKGSSYTLDANSWTIPIPPSSLPEIPSLAVKTRLKKRRKKKGKK